MMMASADQLMMQVNLFISGRKLRDLDTFSKSDPMCLLFEQVNGGSWTKIGQTEQVRNSLNPDFTTSFTLPYFFEKSQQMKLVVIDGDGTGDYDEIGSVEVTMGNLMGAPSQIWTGNLSHKGQSNRGKIIVRAEAVAQSNEVLRSGMRLENVNNFGGGCMGMCQERIPYRVEVQKQIQGDQFASSAQLADFHILESRTLHETVQPLGPLCNADKNLQLRIALVAEDGHTFNSFYFTIQDLMNGSTTFNGNGGATCTFTGVRVYVRPNFLDYLRSGWAVSLVAAIDYTASNDHPSSQNSLHYLGPNNQYELALYNVGLIVEPYDADRSFPVFGFGGIPRHMGQQDVSHCFAVNGQAGNPSIIGIQGIVDTYKSTLPQIGLGGPTLFAPLLQEFNSYVDSVMGSRQYQILLLLTDGAIHDMVQTKNLIFDLAHKPCSVIIVGVGNADFSMMEQLDGDGGRLTNTNGQPCPRDIVQFVELNKCLKRGNLAEQVLKEVPNQLVSYMEMTGEQPQPVAQNMAQFAAQ